MQPTPVDGGIYRAPGHFAAYYRGGEDAHRFWERAQSEAPVTLETIVNNQQFQIDLEQADIEIPGYRNDAMGVHFRAHPEAQGWRPGGPQGSQDGEGNIPFEILIDEKKLQELLFKGLELPHMEGKKAAAETELVGVKLVGLGPARVPMPISIGRRRCANTSCASLPSSTSIPR